MRHELDFFNPWHQLHRVRRELEQNGSRHQTPLSIWVGEDGGKIRMPLPGITPDKIDISVLGDVVTLRGQREEAPGSDDTPYLRKERASGAFHRQVQLPFRVDPQSVKANYTDGILTVTLPRLAADKPQRITVQAA